MPALAGAAAASERGTGGGRWRDAEGGLRVVAALALPVG